MPQSLDESFQLYDWRRERFEELGYPHRTAVLLALSLEVDPYDLGDEVRKLTRRKCPKDLALEIARP